MGTDMFAEEATCDPGISDTDEDSPEGKRFLL